MSILIVDDTPDNILVISGFLKNAGYTDLLKAHSAREAFDRLGLSNPMPTLGVDLILMDVMMPEISGVDACKVIKAVNAFKDTPIIMVTAKTDSACLKDAFTAGATDYITKPVIKTELLARSQSALRLKHEMDARKCRELELRNKNDELAKALEEIRVLRGFLPICADCKKIRNVEGLWQQMEHYIMEHSEAKFSHGICPECMKKNYQVIPNAKAV